MYEINDKSKIRKINHLINIFYRMRLLFKKNYKNVKFKNKNKIKLLFAFDIDDNNLLNI